ncbi:ABC transporter ATP-binding protein [Geomesophilobacter sediminis]|uniref:ATP-binding cassette domain-containing protein n=1 Tax=Geomesophilobacter sediminis TaxID=2798584 RepID=A0A8J7S9C9_9BACT|nr:ATP-binding cassette domain-containing protein [Geomesophilobacter sediminis]MBJ6726700.1 ATP-binding cassette domain-containing protein [Geomesophilobacter sediminis]
MGDGKDNQAVKIRVENVGVVRGVPGGSVVIVDDVSFAAGRGETTTIIGPSGSGKSTLIRLLNRLDEPSSGRIYLDDTETGTLDPLELRRRVAMVLQKPFMFPGSVLDNLQLPFRYRNAAPPSADSDEVRRAVALARLSPDFLDREARSLSGGEQQRVNLARALIGRPEVLLLDEPTSALDRPTADHLAATLHDVCRSEQLAIVMVTHDLRLAQHTADHLIYLEKGRVVEEGGAAELLARPQTEAFRQFLAEPAWEKESTDGK